MRRLCATLAAISALLAAPSALADDAPPGTTSTPAPSAATSTSPDAAPAPAPATATATATATAKSDPATDAPPRPPPLGEATNIRELPWDRLLDVGGSFAIVERPATRDANGAASPVRYQPATGFELHLRFPLLTNLHIEGYYVDSHHTLTLPQGSLGLADAVAGPSVETYVFGARLSPRLQLGRVTGWLSAGIGWGRLEFGRMTATSASGGVYTLRERGSSFVEVPIGFGVAWEVIPRWLSIDVGATAAFVTEQHGDAMSHGQAVDAAGSLTDIGPFPVLDVSLVQTIGFSLLL